MKYLIVILLALCVAGIANAEINVPAKVGVAYNFDDHKVEEAVGATLPKCNDLFVKGLDIDLLITSERGETLTSDEKNGLLQASYNYEITPKLSVFAGLGLGFRDCFDIQAIRDNNNVEIDKYASLGIEYRF